MKTPRRSVVTLFFVALLMLMSVNLALADVPGNSSTEETSTDTVVDTDTDTDTDTSTDVDTDIDTTADTDTDTTTDTDTDTTTDTTTDTDTSSLIESHVDPIYDIIDDIDTSSDTDTDTDTDTSTDVDTDATTDTDADTGTDTDTDTSTVAPISVIEINDALTSCDRLVFHAHSSEFDMVGYDMADVSVVPNQGLGFENFEVGPQDRVYDIDISAVTAGHPELSIVINFVWNDDPELYDGVHLFCNVDTDTDTDTSTDVDTDTDTGTESGVEIPGNCDAYACIEIQSVDCLTGEITFVLGIYAPPSEPQSVELRSYVRPFGTVEAFPSEVTEVYSENGVYTVDATSAELTGQTEFVVTDPNGIGRDNMVLTCQVDTTTDTDTDTDTSTDADTDTDTTTDTDTDTTTDTDTSTDTDTGDDHQSDNPYGVPDAELQGLIMLLIAVLMQILGVILN